MQQSGIWLITVVGMSFVSAIYLLVLLKSREEGDGADVKARFYRIRPWWFALLVVVIGAASVITLRDMPYADTHGRATSPADVTVELVAHQWYWEISQVELPVNKDIAFEVRSADVNHNFAIYDEEDRLLVQAQAMPGYTNVARYRFDEPGTYTILCLEYCGLAHHAMMKELNVLAEMGQHDEQE